MASFKHFCRGLFFAGVLALSPAYSDTNLLTNPSFETGAATGWSGFGCNIKDLGYRLTSDPDGDCLVDYADLLVMIDQWLSSSPIEIPPNYSPDISFPADDKVNVLDFAVLSTEWLICNDPQDSNCTKNW